MSFIKLSEGSFVQEGLSDDRLITQQDECEDQFTSEKIEFFLETSSPLSRTTSAPVKSANYSNTTLERSHTSLNSRNNSFTSNNHKPTKFDHSEFQKTRVESCSSTSNFTVENREAFSLGPMFNDYSTTGHIDNEHIHTNGNVHHDTRTIRIDNDITLISLIIEMMPN